MKSPSLVFEVSLICNNRLNHLLLRVKKAMMAEKERQLH
jgi:hypothetical protein